MGNPDGSQNQGLSISNESESFACRETKQMMDGFHPIWYYLKQCDSNCTV